jgi:hypothetical protein
LGSSGLEHEIERNLKWRETMLKIEGHQTGSNICQQSFSFSSLLLTMMAVSFPIITSSTTVTRQNGSKNGRHTYIDRKYQNTEFFVFLNSFNVEKCNDNIFQPKWENLFLFLHCLQVRN